MHHKSRLLLNSRWSNISGMSSPGTLLCLASAAAFGAMGIFGKLAYDEGATVGTLLAVRFVLAAALFWVFLAASGGAGRLRALGRRDIAIALALGAVGYSAQAGGYFAALHRLDASLLSLLVYTFPTIVTVAGIALGRERASLRTVFALALASTGLVLVLAGPGRGALDPIGTALGLTTAFVYSAYILASEGVAARIGPLALSTLVCTGAAITLALVGLLDGDLRPGAMSGAGWGWITAITMVSTVGAVGLFFAGLSRVGPSAASILSTLEPVVTVVLAFAVFGESFNGAQLVGAALVLSAVIVVRARIEIAHTPAQAAHVVEAS